jgi:hypothetical protein
MRTAFSSPPKLHGDTQASRSSDKNSNLQNQGIVYLGVLGDFDRCPQRKDITLSNGRGLRLFAERRAGLHGAGFAPRFAALSRTS